MQIMEGIKILDIIQFIAGSRCTHIFADMGAEVVKVELPEGDTLRTMFKLTPAAKKIDVSGTWNMSVELPTGSGNPVFKLVQKGNEITGTYVGRLGESQVTGTIKGNDIVLTYKAGSGDQQVTVKYIGKVQGNTMKGKVDMGQIGMGPSLA